MRSIRVEKFFDFEPTMVWKIVSDWSGTDKWIPGVGSLSVTGTSVGSTRSTDLSDDTGFPGRITERLEFFSQENMKFKYSISADNPLPLKNYLAEISVLERDGGCVAIWSSKWEEDGIDGKKLEDMLRELYRISLNNVGELIKNSSS